MRKRDKRPPAISGGCDVMTDSQAWKDKNLRLESSHHHAVHERLSFPPARLQFDTASSLCTLMDRWMRLAGKSPPVRLGADSSCQKFVGDSFCPAISVHFGSSDGRPAFR
jgi:hypothetical protein